MPKKQKVLFERVVTIECVVTGPDEGQAFYVVVPADPTPTKSE